MFCGKANPTHHGCTNQHWSGGPLRKVSGHCIQFLTYFLTCFLGSLYDMILNFYQSLLPSSLSACTTVIRKKIERNHLRHKSFPKWSSLLFQHCLGEHWHQPAWQISERSPGQTLKSWLQPEPLLYWSLGQSQSLHGSQQQCHLCHELIPMAQCLQVLKTVHYAS